MCYLVQPHKFLSEKRAKAVVEYLTKKHGINRELIKSIGYGEEKLKNVLEPEAAENRRVEVFAFEIQMKNKLKQIDDVQNDNRVKIEW